MMKKMPTIFERDPDKRSRVLDKPTIGCEWVFAGEGVATRKYDGTCCLVEDGVLYRRRTVKKGRPIPPDFVPVDHDDFTHKTVGWVPVSPNKPGDGIHVAAFDAALPNGTYELLGPKVQGNPEHYDTHTLRPHASAVEYSDVPRTFDGLRGWLSGRDIEGLVFRHADGRMAKIKGRDFGLSRSQST